MEKNQIETRNQSEYKRHGKTITSVLFDAEKRKKGLACFSKCTATLQYSTLRNDFSITGLDFPDVLMQNISFQVKINRSIVV